MVDPMDLSLVTVQETTYRVIPSRFPPIDLLERVASAEDFDILYEIESLTNPRLRNEVGDIRLIPEQDRLYGPGTSLITAAFTHVRVDGDGGRFDRGFGVYYSARELETAIEETKYHRAKFFRDFDSGPTQFDMRELVADLNQTFYTVAARQSDFPEIYHLTDYSASQALALSLKTEDAWGIQYSSVRTEGTCYGVFRPPALSNCRQSKHFEYYFDGREIAHVVEKRLWPSG